MPGPGTTVDDLARRAASASGAPRVPDSPLTSAPHQRPGPATPSPDASSAPRQPRLGDVLVARGLLGQATVDRAAEVAAATGSRLGEVLVATGAIDSVTLAGTLAEQWDLPFVAPDEEPVDPALLAGIDIDDVLRQRWLPLGRDADGTVRVAVTDLPGPDRLARLSDQLGAPVRLCMAEQWAMQRALLGAFDEQVIDRAALGLWGRSPDQSARSVLVPWQRWVGGGATLALLAALVMHPRHTASGLLLAVSLTFAVATTFKFWASMRGAGATHAAQTRSRLSDAELPRYTVLVPVYREANIVHQLIANLGRLDYPTHLLEVLILVEEDDDETREAALASDPPPHFQIVVVPSGGPKTKPKACNVGLDLATGECLVIYDAEDRPDPDQLKKAVAAFRAGGDDLVCVQAALNYFNATENVLTRMFTLEYSFWFDYMLPGLEALRLPIPLGGTSNHFRVDGLRRLGGWDPFNVTEDADLGIRASAMGMRVGVIDSTTFEEANTSVPNWIRQRSRWIKGYLQTTLVHLRRPVHLVRVAGVRQAVSFLFLVAGTPATFLAVPPMYALFVASLVLDRGALAGLMPGWTLWISLANLGVGSALMVQLSMMGALKRRRFDLALWGLLNPLYWVLHSIAAYKALWQLMTRPHYWEKTQHGLTTMSAQEPAVEGGTHG
jgi:cellulose synthase/poly-beta-1,6-N-acetylglucosamine synthase-like glycosyltransferase